MQCTVSLQSTVYKYQLYQCIQCYRSTISYIYILELVLQYIQYVQFYNTTIYLVPGTVYSTRYEVLVYSYIQCEVQYYDIYEVPGTRYQVRTSTIRVVVKFSEQGILKRYSYLLFIINYYTVLRDIYLFIFIYTILY